MPGADGPSLRLADLLNLDGTLSLPRGVYGSVDPSGYRMVSGSGDAPRFVPIGRSGSPADAPGDENWASDFGSTIPGVNGYVNALALDGSGNLYAGGDFTTAGGVSANRVAKWNGSKWSALGSGLNNVCLCPGGGRQREPVRRRRVHHRWRGRCQPRRQMGRQQRGALSAVG